MITGTAIPDMAIRIIMDGIDRITDGTTRGIMVVGQAMATIRGMADITITTTAQASRGVARAHMAGDIAAVSQAGAQTCLPQGPGVVLSVADETRSVAAVRHHFQQIISTEGQTATHTQAIRGLTATGLTTRETTTGGRATTILSTAAVARSTAV